MIPKNWKEESIENWIEEYKEKTTVNDQYPIMTSSRSGLILQSDYYGENRLTVRDNVGFNVIPPNYITYRSRSDDGLFFFNKNKLGKTGAISIYYPVFHFPKGDTDYFMYLLNYHARLYEAYSVGTSQKVLSLNSLLEIKFKIPPTEEQRKIADVLSTWDRAIELIDSEQPNKMNKGSAKNLKLAYIKQKQGLMQKLLTGKVRVKV